jgi:hypothetical protein
MAKIEEYLDSRLNHVYVDGGISIFYKAWLIIYYAFKYPLRETTFFWNGISKYNKNTIYDDNGKIVFKERFK